LYEQPQNFILNQQVFVNKETPYNIIHNENNFQGVVSKGENGRRRSNNSADMPAINNSASRVKRSSPKNKSNFHKHQTKMKSNFDYENLSSEELAASAPFLAKDQTGCRFLQKRIEDEPYFANDVLFPCLYDNIVEYMTDAFGNYLIQKIIENLDDKNFEKIIFTVYPHFLNLGLDSHGTRVIQKIIERINSERHLDLFNKVFKQFAVDLMKDINGNHVIIKYVSVIQYPSNQFMYDQVIDNLIEIVTDKHACCAFQKCIDFAEKNQRLSLIDKIIENTYILMSDPYGNYVLQYILMLNDYVFNSRIVSYFANRLGYLSKQKFSSNVIEKCFDHCSNETIFKMVKELCNKKIIEDLLMDMFGNYGNSYFLFI
jgi:hypothetical protein